MRLPHLFVPGIMAAVALCLTQLPAAAQGTQRNLNVKVDECPAPSLLLKGPDTAKPEDKVILTWDAVNVSDFRMDGIGNLSGDSVQVKPSCCGKVTYTLRGVSTCGADVVSNKTINVIKGKVFLSGSRYSSWPSIAQYMQWNLTSFSYMASDVARAGLDEFLRAMTSWPPSADVFNQAHVGGRTDIVDERGNVLGSLNTFSLFSWGGVPGVSYLGNPSGFVDYNKVFLTASTQGDTSLAINGGDATLTINGMTYDVVGFSSVSPIILDLDGDSKPDVDQGRWLPHPTRFNKEKALVFDINGDGFKEVTEWLGAGDGLLVAAKDGQVKGGNELFGNPIGFVDGYQKLGLEFDKDENGKVEGKELESLMVWQDNNRDGKAQGEELRSVQELGISSISTKQDNLKSSFVMKGQERATWDWWPTCMLVYPSVLAKAETK